MNYPRIPSLALLALPALLAGNSCSTDELPTPNRPDIILVSIDTLRADHCELYGYDRATIPNIAKLGREGVVFERAISQAPWTLPSMASVHTGLYPSEHGALNNLSPMPSDRATVAEVMQAAGYRTQAVVSHVFTGRKYGFGRGFDVIDERFAVGHDGISSKNVTETALEFMSEPTDAPTFLWVHYFDPHYTYIRHAEHNFATGEPGRFEDFIRVLEPDGSDLGTLTPEELTYVKDVYDEEIAYVDFWIGTLIDGIRAGERERPALFVVTADHGEAFFERGYLGHGKEVFDEMIHVPLVIGGDIDANLRGRKVSSSVETRSIGATLLTMAGISGHSVPGTDLYAIANGAPAPDFAFSEGSYARGTDRRKLSAVEGAWKLIYHYDDESLELFNRDSDPNELVNLIDDQESAQVRERLRNAVAEKRALFEASKAEQATVDLTDEERKNLEDLGYFDEDEEEPEESTAPDDEE